MITLHPYQRDAVRCGITELDRAQAALCVMPTGVGKSVVGTAVAAEVVRRGGRALILLHRKELIEQWSRTCTAFGLSWAIEQAENNARRETMFGRADVVLGSKDTMQGKRLEKWSPHTFSVIIPDECHHSNQKSWMEVFSHFHSAKRFGLTATPERTDEESIQPVFGKCCYEMKLWEAIDGGWLAPPLFRRPAAPLDLSMLRATSEDLNQGDLEDAISKHIEELVNLARPEIDGRPTMAFTPRVFSASAMADGFRQVGVTSCSVSGTSEDRDKVIQDFRDQKYQLLASCDLLREGVDFPHASAAVMARPTKSGLVYRQTLGRVLRTHPGKEWAIVVDYAWNSGKHNLFQPIDLFDTTGMDLDILKLAGKLLDAGEGDARKALKEAERVHKQQVSLRVQVQERTPSYQMLAYDPFQVGALLGIPNRQREGMKPCSAKNRARLEARKLSPKGMADVQARKLLQELDRRQEAHLATHRQVALLVTKGVPIEHAQQMTFEAAQGDLDIIMQDDRRRA